MLAPIDGIRRATDAPPVTAAPAPARAEPRPLPPAPPAPDPDLPTRGTAPSALNPAEQRALAEHFAPILYFHPDEKYFLQDPDVFLDESSLRKERDWWTDKEIHGQGDVPADALPDIGPENEDADSQRFLDHDDDRRAGELGNAKNLYQYDPETNSVTYFFFYSYNDGPAFQNHEGDWERITVQLDDDFEPTEVRYAAHEGLDSSRGWSDVTTEGDRPVVYVGNGTHASYPEPGRWNTVLGFLDETAMPGDGDAVRFDTASADPVDVTGEAWYGSHVLWGERGSMQEIGQNWTSGPTGPSATKGPVTEGDHDREPLPVAESPDRLPDGSDPAPGLESWPPGSR